jgi:cell division protein FtsZ
METMARLRAAIKKEPAEVNSSKVVDERSQTDRPKFGISSLISRMSRSEAVSLGPIGGDRKEPNLNSDVAENRESDDLEQEKIEVPAFLRRQAN